LAEAEQKESLRQTALNASRVAQDSAFIAATTVVRDFQPKISPAGASVLSPK
jgi:hypothetical protein